jgi:DNA-binding transcriptional LysR family regulator
MPRLNGQVDWEDLHFFLVLAQRGAVRPAGLALGVSHTTVARRVEALEETLATRLFDRHRDGFVLTEDGRQLMATASRIAEEVARVSRDLSGRDGRLEGLVRITCGDEFMAAWILEALTPWCGAHPGVDLCIHTDFRLFDLAKGEADLALRVVATGARPPDHLVGTVVAPLTVANYVATEHAARLSPGQPQARWLGFTDPRPARALLISGSYPDLPVWGAFSTLDLVVRAVRAGLGLAMLPTYVADPDPLLQRLPQADLRTVADIWLLHHPDLRGNARVRGARAELKAAFSRNAGLFRGQ